MILRYPKRLAALLLAALAFSFSAQAGGVRSVRIPAVSYAARPIVVDGKLDDWGGAEAVTYEPFYDISLATDATPEVRQLQQNPSLAKVSYTYDGEALYVGMEWKGSHPASNTAPASADGAANWWKSGDGVEFHLLADKTLHVASWPVNGQMTATAVRVGDKGEWKQGTDAGITSAIVLNAAKNSYTEEIRIPWTLLTTSGKAPTSGIAELACDVVWKDINAGVLQKLPLAVRSNSHFTANFFSASIPYSSESYSANMYRSNPGDWGDLIFGTEVTPLRVERSTLGTAIASWSIPRANQAPEINGDLKEWNAPFADLGILPGLLGSRYGVKVSMQYDAENLYLAAHFQTSGPSPTPYQNLKSEGSQQGFAGGDALQIRLNNGKGRSVNLCGWFDSAANKPALTADQGDINDNFLLPRGAKEAFQTDADQMGYTQEIAIPWKLIYPDQESPKAGDHWKLTFQPWWSGLDPRFAFAGQAKLSKRSALNVTYDLPGEGEVSLGVYDGTKLISNVLKGEFRSKGKITDAWNGLDQWGNPVPPGNYQLKGLYHPRVTTDYLMSFGNPGNPSWPTPDGKGDWLSDEACPQAATTDGKWVFLAAPGCEKASAIIAVDENGQRQWGVVMFISPVAISLAVEGDYLYVLNSGPELTGGRNLYIAGGTNAIGRATLMCLDKRTGQPAKFTLKTPQLKVATWPFDGRTTGLWELRTNKSYSPDTYAGQPRYATDDVGETTNAMGIAALNNRLYLAMHEENKILVLNADNGEKLDEIAVPKPSGIHALADNTLLVVSDKQVVRVDVASKSCKSVVKSGLVAPRCVTADKQGQIYVSDWGNSFQVKVFTPKGEQVRAIGKKGGRPWEGPWEANGMLVPTGIAVTEAGKLWVMEDDACPKRVSVWNPENGGLLKEYVGPGTYGGGGSIVDPQDISIAYALGTRFKLDYDKKTWTPQATIGRRMDANQPFAYQGHTTFPGGKLVRHDGREYIVRHNSGVVVVYQRKGDLFLPVAAVGTIRNDLITNGTQKAIWDSDLGHRIIENWAPPFFKEHLGSNYTWTDLNGDNIVQPEEMSWFKTLGRGDVFVKGAQPDMGGYWGGYDIGDDWNAFFAGTSRGTVALYRLDIKGWTPAGAPIYDIKDSVLIHERETKSDILSLYAASEGKVFLDYGYDFNPGQNSLECFDRDGKSLWAYPLPKEYGKKDVHFENILSEFTIPGLGKVLATWSWHGNFLPYLFTSDGLFVSSSLLEVGRIGPQAAWDESFKSYFQDSKGVPYIINGASSAYHILKINGLEGGRFEAPFTLTEADVAQATKQREVPVVKEIPKPILNVAWPAQAPTIDGTLNDWNLREGVALEGEKGRTARIAISRDETNLYLAYEVNKDLPLSNKGGDWRQLFVTGDCVDLMIATNPKADPNRQSAAQGDQRLLFSLFQGKPVAVLSRPVVPGSTSVVQLMAARLDEVKLLDSAKVGLTSNGNSYTIEASVPLKDLGIDPNNVGALRGDVGVIFSDETGASRSQRLYYYNKKTGMTADLTTEATLQPGEWGTILFPLGKNLLKNGGFNDGFATKPEDGWFPAEEKNGAHARIGTDSPRSGAQSLILEQTEPLTYPDAAFNAPDFSTFMKSASGGKGGGAVFVTQRVPVTAGHSYSLRVNYRAKGLKSEIQRPGPDRGYACFGISMDWIRPNTAPDGRSFVGVFNTKEDSHDWKQFLNWNCSYSLLDKPYIAPIGSTAVNIMIRLNTEAANCTPSVYLDDLEFIEVPLAEPAK